MKQLFLCLMLAFLVQPCTAQQDLPPEGKIALRVLYAGIPDSARQKDFVSFMNKHFVSVETVDVKAFDEAQAEDSDVVILDKDGIQWGSRGGNPLRDLQLPQSYARATLALGIPGAFLYHKMRLKPGYR